MLSLHAMVGRVTSATDPAVLTVAQIQAGTTYNVIPEDAYVRGTIRTLSENARARLQEQVTQVATNSAAAHGCACTTRIDAGYPVTVNDPAEVDRSRTTAGALFGEDSFHTMPTAAMASEDFSYVLNEVPGSMAFLGVCPPGVELADSAPNHSNLMTIHEDAMAQGVAMYAAMALA